jgi:hypothetical protein
MAGLLIGSLVEVGDLGDPSSTVSMFQGQDLVVRPVEVIGDEGYLLDQLVEGVAEDPPRPARSTSKSCSQLGHDTVWLPFPT